MAFISEENIKLQSVSHKYDMIVHSLVYQLTNSSPSHTETLHQSINLNSTMVLQKQKKPDGTHHDVAMCVFFQCGSLVFAC